jgi:hypothetical protein
MFARAWKKKPDYGLNNPKPCDTFRIDKAGNKPHVPGGTEELLVVLVCRLADDP